MIYLIITAVLVGAVLFILPRKTKKKRIKNSRFLTNICYMENGQKRFSFGYIDYAPQIEIVDKNKDYSNDNDIAYVGFKSIINNKEFRILKSNIVGQVFSPFLYRRLYRELHICKNFVFYCAKENVSLIYVSDVGNTVEKDTYYNRVEFKDGDVFIDNIKFSKISDVYIGNKRVDKLSLINKLFYLEPEHKNVFDISLLFKFSKHINMYKSYDNCLKSSKFLFINYFELQEDEQRLVRENLNVVNLINSHIEIFGLLKRYGKQHMLSMFRDVFNVEVGNPDVFMLVGEPIDDYAVELCVSNVNEKYEHDVIDKLRSYLLMERELASATIANQLKCV
jgi:hypothetical protein